MIHHFRINPKDYDRSFFGSDDVKNTGVENMEKIKAVIAKIIEEGEHTGEIVHIMERKKPFHYVDVVIRLPDDTGTELKRGYPASISGSSALGKLLMRFGVSINEGLDYDVEKELKGKKVTFMTMNKKTEKGTFTDIIPESIKPL